MRKEIIEQVKEKKIIVIVRKVYKKDCENLIHALWEGGIRLVEFTFDQDHPDEWIETCNNISSAKEKYNGKMFVGAGTVLTRDQVHLAKKAGASFVISPDVKEEVIKETLNQDMVSIPGAFSPSEIVSAYDWGADFVKVFPAGNLGASYIRAIKGPLNHIPLLAVGGVSYKNIGEFLKAGAAGAGLGGEIVDKDRIAAGDFAKITEIAHLTIEKCMEGVS